MYVHNTDNRNVQVARIRGVKNGIEEVVRKMIRVDEFLWKIVEFREGVLHGHLANWRIY